MNGNALRVAVMHFSAIVIPAKAGIQKWRKWYLDSHFPWPAAGRHGNDRKVGAAIARALFGINREP